MLRVHRARDWPQQFAVEFGFGLALWPVLFLWTSTLSWRWNSFSVSQFVAVLSIAGVLSLTLRSREVWRSRIRYLRRNAVWLAGWCGLMALAVASRLHHVARHGPAGLDRSGAPHNDRAPTCRTRKSPFFARPLYSQWGHVLPLGISHTDRMACLAVPSDRSVRYRCRPTDLRPDSQCSQHIHAVRFGALSFP